MSVRARVVRLERAAGIGQMCLGCKRNLILYSDTIRRTRPEDLIVHPCDACGFPSFTIIGGYSERELALMRELFFSPYASPPRTLAERQRHYAAQLYYYILPRTHEIRKVGEREEGRLRGLSVRSESARAQLKILDEWKAREEDSKAARRLSLSEEEEVAREERRAKAAPTMAVIERVKAAHTPAGRSPTRSGERLYYLQLMAELEVLVYGETLPETRAKIGTLRREEQEKQEREEREARERSERLERERLEREEQYRREREERERQRLERLGDARPAQARPARPAADSDFGNEAATMGPVMVPPSIDDIIAAHCPSYVRAEGTPRNPDGLEPVAVPDVPCSMTRDVSRPTRWPHRPSRGSAGGRGGSARHYRGENYDGGRRY